MRLCVLGFLFVRESKENGPNVTSTCIGDMSAEPQETPVVANAPVDERTENPAASEATIEEKPKGKPKPFKLPYRNQFDVTFKNVHALATDRIYSEEFTFGPLKWYAQNASRQILKSSPPRSAFVVCLRPRKSRFCNPLCFIMTSFSLNASRILDSKAAKDRFSNSLSSCCSFAASVQAHPSLPPRKRFKPSI